MPTQTEPGKRAEWPADVLADPNWAWQPFRPDRRRPWNLPWAAHLFRRATFGANWKQLEQALADGPQLTVDRLLKPEADDSTTVAGFNRTSDEFETAAADSIESLRAWWLRRMIQTPHPLLEKMTLFWHGFFAVSNSRVGNARSMCQYVQLLRKHALGPFSPMLEGLVRDPAVLVGLGGEANRKAQPNVALAQNLLEHFILGPGNFSEKDAQEVARAFSGCFVRGGRFRYIQREHDSAEKSILGRKGNFDDRDVVRIVLKQPAPARLVVRRLYRWLINETNEPDDKMIAPLAESFARDLDVARLLGTILRSNLFYSPAAYRQRIKCPVEYALGIVRGLEATVATAPLGRHLAQLGQNLYDPPTMDGWQGGRCWINQFTLLDRSNLALALVSGVKPYEKKLDPAALAARYGHHSPEAAGRFIVDLFLQADLADNVDRIVLEGIKTQAGPDQLRRLVHRVATLPEFHLA